MQIDSWQGFIEKSIARHTIAAMRFNIGSVPTSPDFAPDGTWKALREPDPWVAQLIAFPIGLLTATIITVLWFVITPLREAKPSFTIPAMLLAIIVTTVVHELIHAIVHPLAGLSSHTVLGFWPSQIAFYAHYDGELTRNRFVAILLMPFLIVSILPMVVAALVGAPFFWLAFASLINAMLACMDILGTGMVLFQIPATAIVRNQGWRTYWRAHETVASQ